MKEVVGSENVTTDVGRISCLVVECRYSDVTSIASVEYFSSQGMIRRTVLTSGIEITTGNGQVIDTVVSYETITLESLSLSAE